MTLLIVAAYVLPALVCCRMIAGHVAWKEKFRWEETPEGDDWAWGWVLGACGALIWPLFALVLVVRAHSYRFPRFRWAVGAERAGRAKAAEQRIADLERELGIR